MKKKLVFMALILTTLSISPAFAKPELVLNVDPEPLYDQMWAFETYTVNISLTGLDISEYSEFDLSGRVIADGIIRWKGTGQYTHGAGVTGYSYNLDEEVYRLIASIDDPSLKLNLSLSQDAFQYGMKPFEDIELMLNFDVFFELNDEIGMDNLPLLGSVSSTYILMDNEKRDYLKDMLLEIEAEVHAATEAQGVPDFNRTKYVSIVSAMNASINSGNYLRAQDQWENWDEKDRLEMFEAFSRHVNSRVEEFESIEFELEGVESELDGKESELEGVESELDLAHIEYNLLEDKYFALITNNQRTISELESTKQGLTTSITGIFLSAMVFFFLGRRSNITGEV
ncbi:hypothetical protein HN807_12925 [Candidatus Bathyarchaeota archaeon]|jgi:hypothetical protein|nr:hypothetical protein [Candidatus Bathyarchaeota archaeon]MBT4319592.1 hypothetical protein [Candidatus Bathyarchaeota archaeon]MBT4422792.1 hypothetical protein [Candidatus Bathyarchaeota archaeon]MBT5642659.1 hypothetical protein [Candidatus Bathyarchaeota archaeon]MBT6603461.1 hypothetical protein [Candidatus Bathyarchaeota archaeon]